MKWIRRKAKKTKPGRQLLSSKGMSIRGEVDYIVGRAAANEFRVVTLGPLVFFSTETGNGWMLDPQDGLASCLARDGDPLPAEIKETDDGFAIEWSSVFQIEREFFTFTDRLSGETKTVWGYPTQAILSAVRNMGSATQSQST